MDTYAEIEMQRKLDKLDKIDELVEGLEETQESIGDLLNVLSEKQLVLNTNFIHTQTGGPLPDFKLSATVLGDLATSAYIMACMNLGNSIRILCELRRPAKEIHDTVDGIIKMYTPTEGLVVNTNEETQ